MTTTVRIIPKTPQAPKNEGAIRTLEAALEDAKANPNTSNIMILMKIDDGYYRYSSSLDAPMEVIAQLELGKFDIVLGMAGVTSKENS